MFVFALIPLSAAKGQSLSASAWEHFPCGTAVKLELRGSKLTAYIRNESDSPKVIIGAFGHLVRFFYLDENGKRVQLGHLSGVDEPSQSKVSASATIPKSGEAPLEVGIELTPDEVSFAKARNLTFYTVVQNLETKTYFRVESPPKRLISE